MPQLNIPSGQALASSNRWGHDDGDDITMIKSDPNNDYDQATAWWGVKSAKDCHAYEEEGFWYEQGILFGDVHRNFISHFQGLNADGEIEFTLMRSKNFKKWALPNQLWVIKNYQQIIITMSCQSTTYHIIANDSIFSTQMEAWQWLGWVWQSALPLGGWDWGWWASSGGLFHQHQHQNYHHHRYQQNYHQNYYAVDSVNLCSISSDLQAKGTLMHTNQLLQDSYNVADMKDLFG